jgi:hypothetical protein
MTYGCAEASGEGIGCEDRASRRHGHIAIRMADTNTTADFIGEAPFLRGDKYNPAVVPIEIPAVPIAPQVLRRIARLWKSIGQNSVTDRRWTTRP